MNKEITVFLVEVEDWIKEKYEIRGLKSGEYLRKMAEYINSLLRTNEVLTVTLNNYREIARNNKVEYVDLLLNNNKLEAQAKYYKDMYLKEVESKKKLSDDMHEAMTISVKEYLKIRDISMDGDYRNGVTDSTGSVDEGSVMYSVSITESMNRMKKNEIVRNYLSVSPQD